MCNIYIVCVVLSICSKYKLNHIVIHIVMRLHIDCIRHIQDRFVYAIDAEYLFACKLVDDKTNENKT